jgi:16S rRNA C1402 (ribose-2'-O) methylase RsmI
MPDENFVRGTLEEIRAHFVAAPFRGEFVIVVEGKTDKGKKGAE